MSDPLKEAMMAVDDGIEEMLGNKPHPDKTNYTGGEPPTEEYPMSTELKRLLESRLSYLREAERDIDHAIKGIKLVLDYLG